MSKTISIEWSVEDVLYQAKNDEVKLHESQAEEILEIMDRKHDATIGINWDVISEYISMYKAGSFFKKINVKEAGICPNCLSNDIEYGAIEVSDAAVYYPITCNNCNEDSKEWYNMIYVETVMKHEN